MSTLSRPAFLDGKSPPTFLTLIALASITALTMNMFIPSLPAMTEYFHTEYRIMQLSVAVFMAANALVQLFVGPISDRFGRRPVLIVGLSVFVLASLGCVLAPTATSFLVFRAIQAAVVVSMVLSRTIVRDMYDHNKAASMIGYVTMFMSIVPMVTPAIGGFLDEHLGWHSNFWVLVFSGIVVLALVLFDCGETNQHKSASFRDQFASYPELFSSPRFWGYSLAATFASGAFFAYLGGSPFVGTVVFGLSPSALGIFFGAPSVGYLVGNGITGAMAGKVGINRLIVLGTLLTMTAVAIPLVLTVTGQINHFTFFGPMILLGFGNGLVIPNATVGILSVRPKLAGTASGVGGALMIGGGAGLSALSGSLLKPGIGPGPLLWIMLAVTVLGLLSILFVIWRERSLGIA